jgi:Amt family ammonium transporter
MRTMSRIHRQRRWLAAGILAVLLATAAAPAMADDPVPDKTGAFQTTPTAYSVPATPSRTRRRRPRRISQSPSTPWRSPASHGLFSSNFVWTLVAGFLVMFMQAGFALVETGLIRAKNAAHTMSMNFAVYGLGMLGFFICGFAFMCGGSTERPSAARRHWAACRRCTRC